MTLRRQWSTAILSEQKYRGAHDAEYFPRVCTNVVKSLRAVALANKICKATALLAYFYKTVFIIK